MDRLGNPVYRTLPPEDDEGDIEYKWNLACMNNNKRTKITSQMRWRVQEASENNSTLYILGVHDNGQLTGLARNDLVATYLNLMDCARNIGLYTCMRRFKQIEGTDRYWAILQIFACSSTNFEKSIPPIPDHEIPDYLYS